MCYNLANTGHSPNAVSMLVHRRWPNIETSLSECPVFVGNKITTWMHFVFLVSVVGVRLPGREQRVKEPFMTDLSALCKKIAAEIYSLYSDKPLALFGHR